MLRVVLDSNVYISALIFGGNPRAILELAEERLFEISISEPIKTEVERILGEKFLWPNRRVGKAISYLVSLSHSITPHKMVTDCSDPDDNRILECALPCGRDCDRGRSHPEA